MVIIGGGIIGVATAYFLAEKGVSVLLCEKGQIGAEQSSRNWGWCRTMGRDLREMPLAQASLRLWRDLIAGASVPKPDSARPARFICAPMTRRWRSAKPGSAACQAYRCLDRASCAAPKSNQTLAGTAGHWAGGLFTPDDGVAEPHMAAPAIALAARQLGAKIMTNCAVRRSN